MGISVLLLVVVLALVAVVVVVMVVARRRGRKADEPVCGSCGYAVRGLPTFTCPECGADLRDVGIRTADERGPLGPVTKAVLWTLVLPVPALALTMVAGISVLPWFVTRWDSIKLSQPNSQLYTRVDIRATSRFVTWGRRPPRPPAPRDSAELTLLPLTGPSMMLTADGRTGACTYAAADGGTVTGSLDREFLTEWFSAAGIDVDHPEVRPEVEAVLSHANGALTGKTSVVSGIGFQSASSGSGTTVDSGLTFVPVACFWLVVWLIGLRLLVRARQAGGPSPT